MPVGSVAMNGAAMGHSSSRLVWVSFILAVPIAPCFSAFVCLAIHTFIVLPGTAEANRLVAPLMLVNASPFH
jgi:hypothetical protein